MSSKKYRVWSMNSYLILNSVNAYKSEEKHRKKRIWGFRVLMITCIHLNKNFTTFVPSTLWSKNNVFSSIPPLTLLINLICLIIKSMNDYISEEKHISKRICQHSSNCIIAITCIFVFVGSIFKLITISWNFFRATLFIFNITSLIATIIFTLIVFDINLIFLRLKTLQFSNLK